LKTKIADSVSDTLLLLLQRAGATPVAQSTYQSVASASL
jgi:hypothetical protein